MEKSVERTLQKRPDMLENAPLSKEEKKILAEQQTTLCAEKNN